MKNIAKILVENNIVKTNFTDPFLWTSGIKSPIYCDCREIISMTEARSIVVSEMIQLIEKLNINPEFVAGTATAGIPWAAFVAEKENIPMLYVRSKPKGHGAGKMVEGRGENNKNVLVIEDALSTAGSSIKSAQALRDELEANVSYIFAIFSWDTPSAKINAKNNHLELVPLTNFFEIADALENAGKISASEKKELANFHANPTNWWNNKNS